MANLPHDSYFESYYSSDLGLLYPQLNAYEPPALSIALPLRSCVLLLALALAQAYPRHLAQYLYNSAYLLLVVVTSFEVYVISAAISSSAAVSDSPSSCATITLPTAFLLAFHGLFRSIFRRTRG